MRRVEAKRNALLTISVVRPVINFTGLFFIGIDSEQGTCTMSKNEYPTDVTVTDLTKFFNTWASQENEPGDKFSSKEAIEAARAFYYAPMGLLYCVNNGYHEVAINDIAREFDKRMRQCGGANGTGNC